jgi:hypothetical protein
MYVNEAGPPSAPEQLFIRWLTASKAYIGVSVHVGVRLALV